MGLVFTFAFLYAYDPEEYNLGRHNITKRNVVTVRLLKSKSRVRTQQHDPHMPLQYMPKDPQEPKEEVLE